MLPWQGWGHALNDAALFLATLTVCVSLLRLTRRHRDESLAPNLCLIAFFVMLMAVAQWAQAATQNGAPLALRSVVSALALLVAAAVAVLGIRLERNPSANRLRAINAALREEIEALRHASATQRVDQKMLALTQLAGYISHNFNNILQVIGGNLALVPASPDMPAGSAERLAAALRAVDRSVQITRQLRLFSQQPAHAPKAIDLTAFTSHLIAHLGPQLGDGIALTVDAWTGPARLPLLIDTGELMQMLANLVANAQTAMPAGGALHVGLSTYYASERADLADGYYLRLSVTDTGKGMAADIAAQALEPFFTTSTAQTGAGLGLSVVYGIARRGGGTITLDSHPGQGTTATVFVRIAIAEADPEGVPVPEDGAAISREDFAGLQVMLVDDEYETRAIVAMTLQSLACAVVQAQSGSDALALAERAMAEGALPDLFILDYMMPGMTGAELATALRARHAGCRIVFLTGYADLNAIEAAIGGAANVVYKPASRGQLAQAIEKALG